MFYHFWNKEENQKRGDGTAAEGDTCQGLVKTPQEPARGTPSSSRQLRNRSLARLPPVLKINVTSARLHRGKWACHGNERCIQYLDWPWHEKS